MMIMDGPTDNNIEFAQSEGDASSVMEFAHVPVMMSEVLEALGPADREVYVDGTLGGAGYAMAVLATARCEVIGIDRDIQAINHARKLHPKLSARHGRFGLMDTYIQEPVDGIILDLGVSSVHIDTPERGFSFRHNGPLDMRMDPSAGGFSAAYMVNNYTEEKLAELIFHYGEERRARAIARAIVLARRSIPIETTFDLAEIIRSVVRRSPKDKLDPSTRTFQALRIAVNDELGELEKVLQSSIRLLKPGGRLVVVTFHSLEDGIVKRFLAEHGGESGGGASRHIPVAQDQSAQAKLFDVLYKKALTPSAQEVKDNPRARSAKLRAAIRTDVHLGEVV